MTYLFHLFVYDPIYNLLVLLIDVVPGGDVGIAIILMVIIVKLILLPVSISAVRTQMRIKEADPELKDIQTKFKDNKERLAKETMVVYKKYKINPFSSVLSLFIQIPVIFALYFAIYKGLPVINKALIYSFVSIPESVNMMFLGYFDISKGKILVLALLAAVTQFFQAKLMTPDFKPTNTDPKQVSFKDEMMRGMHIQMKYVMPVFTFFIAYTFMSAVAIYWTISNIFAIGQEYYIRRKIKNEHAK